MIERLISPHTVEEQVADEESRLAGLSGATLRYMYVYGVAWECWLRHHRGNLEFAAEEECDLVEAMRLSSRLNRVDRNIERTISRNEKIRSHLLTQETESDR
ncbi:MAG: hypothetical protein GF400_05320 [Candidatus Eisenbacteria bacterium]|nr:hypothetical protein [Candidatus Eisenbacteria bacterium]